MLNQKLSRSKKEKIFYYPEKRMKEGSMRRENRKKERKKE